MQVWHRRSVDEAEKESLEEWERNITGTEDVLHYPYYEMLYQTISILLEIEQGNNKKFFSREYIYEKTERIESYCKILRERADRLEAERKK